MGTEAETAEKGLDAKIGALEVKLRESKDRVRGLRQRGEAFAKEVGEAVAEEERLQKRTLAEMKAYKDARQRASS